MGRCKPEQQQQRTCSTMGSCSGGFLSGPPCSSHSSNAVSCSLQAEGAQDGQGNAVSSDITGRDRLEQYCNKTGAAQRLNFPRA